MHICLPFRPEPLSTTNLPHAETTLNKGARNSLFSLGGLGPYYNQSFLHCCMTSSHNADQNFCGFPHTLFPRLSTPGSESECSYPSVIMFQKSSNLQGTCRTDPDSSQCAGDVFTRISMLRHGWNEVWGN